MRPLLSITRRPLTPHEKRRLARSLRERPNGRRVELLCLLVIVPLLTAAPLALGLRAAHLPRGLAIAVGLLLGLGLGLFFVARLARRRAPPTGQSAAGLREDLRGDAAQIWEFDVVRAWQVNELDESGPGFLFEVDEEMLVYAATEELRLWGEGRFPTQRVAIHRLPHSKDILTILAAGEPVTPEPDPIPRSELPIVGPVRSELIWRSGLEPALRARLRG